MDSVTQTNILTCGDFDEESAGLSALDNAIERSGAFKIYREVRGTYIQPRFGTEQKSARIDRILVPQPAALNAGWRDGFIGIEGKKSGTKVGKIVSQAMDYSRAVFELPNNGFTIHLRWVFIWPLENPKGDLESIMAQNRIGCVAPDKFRIIFSCGGTHGITILSDGSLVTKPLPMGGKVGSR